MSVLDHERTLLGRLPQNLAAAGIDPSAVDAVVIMHMPGSCPLTTALKRSSPRQPAMRG
jgi:hypothetical protein